MHKRNETRPDDKVDRVDRSGFSLAFGRAKRVGLRVVTKWIGSVQ